MTGLADLAAIVLGRCMAEDFRPRGPHSSTIQGEPAVQTERSISPAVKNAHLRHALREAEQREDELFTLLGHELKQPLASMVTALHLVRYGGLASRSVDMLERQVDHLVRLVDELLNPSLATPSSIKTRLKAKPAGEPVEIRNTVARAVDAVRPSLYACRHTFGISLPEEPLWIRGDSKRLQDVIGTLLSYAARSTQPGGQVWLTATTEGGDAVISVSDNGNGIPADVLPHLFESFRHSEPPPKRSGQGHRAGLALARRWVEMHGGRIEARSTGDGQGNEFIVRLPLNGHGSPPPPSDVS
jgi:signal transduction histidine kinase